MTRDVLRKLRRMSVREIHARTQYLLTQWGEEAGHRLGRHRNPDSDLLPDAEDSRFIDPWIALPEQRTVAERLRVVHPAYVEETVRAAAAICRHEFALFGMVARYGEQVAWQTDPVSGRPWPAEFHTRVRIFDGDKGHGDVKYVWELNRHQFLPVLGKAYRLTGDEKYAAAGLRLIDSWIEANPCNIGINWTSALELAVRTLAWCWACALFEGSPSLTPRLRRRILGSLSQQARYIERHLSFYFSPYNHLIGEATALFVIGSLLPSLRRAAHWRRRGWAILEAEMPKQYHADGGTVEQATGYHHFTLGFHLHAMLVKRHLEGTTSGRLWTDLEKALEFSLHMMRPDGSMPMIGDGDEGKAIALAQSDLWDFRVFLGLGASLFGRGDFKTMGGGLLLPDAAWLVGTDGWAAHDAIQDRVPERTSSALPGSGYYIMRTGWEPQAHYLGFDCGELAAGVSADGTPSAAHGHADALSIEVSAFGEPLLVDPGFWTYNGNLDWHRYFRETEAHNTVVVDGRSQAEFRGRLKWSHAPRIQAHEWITLGGLDYADGSHSGYERLAAVTHRRTVVFLKPYYWVVRDELVGEGEHTIDRCFHFATADLTRDQMTQALQTQSPNGRPNLALIPVERDQLEVDVVRGGPASAEGWLAVGYERKIQGAAARLRTNSSLPCVLHTVLVPFRGGTPWVQVSARPIESDSGSPIDRAFEVARPGGRDIWAFSNGRRARFHDNWSTDARTACVRLDERGTVIGCALVAGSSVEANGTPVLVLDRAVRAATISLVNGRPTIEVSEPATVVASALVASEHIISKAG